MTRSRPVRSLAVILGDQLDRSYLDALGLDRGRDAVLMMEVTEASAEPPSHVQRTVLFLSAMRHFAEAVAADGWWVEYRRLTDRRNTQTFTGELGRAIRALKPERVVAIEPGSHAVLGALEGACDEACVEFAMLEDPHFLCSTRAFEDWASGRKGLIHEHFYRAQRKALGVLVNDDGTPVGGAWNYDKQNRKAFRDAPDPPDVPRFVPDAITREVIADVREALPDLPGRLDGFAWPVTREDALVCLEDFVAHRLPMFGDHQDAMWAGEDTLFHAVISPTLNLKLLDPREVYRAALDAYESGDAPLNAVEGFIRQIIGWREFIRGVYWHEGPGYGDRNALDQHGALPELYWTGETDMECMRHALRSVLDRAYAHHISRLMVTGNFALIAGVEPRAVNDWYHGMYADAIDWVTTPNTIGMAMHADGGVVGTKPYAASGKYIQRMGNYCKACPYNVKARTGDDACPFNTFYWDFLIRNEDRFRRNPRMSLILKHVEKLGSEERVEITVDAKRLRNRMGIGEIDGEPAPA
jgi:deoxyribodipyrimidine photolyase-related protein